MSDNSELVTANLSKVFDIYRSAGILDEGEILENIAFFAILWHFDKMESFELNSKVNPSFHQQRVREDLLSRHLDDLMIAKEFQISDRNLLPKTAIYLTSSDFRRNAELLKDIFRSVDNLGKWFDQDLIPRLSVMSKGGRYVTPRHLVRFMAGVAGLNQSDSVADFACGTGGMLVANGLVQRATGIEISPNMARLALTNLILHGQIQHDLYLGNAFDVANRNSQFIESKFDVVVMNPPFDARIEPMLISQSFERTQFYGDFKGNSATTFTALAYEKLRADGRMAVLIPSTLLFSNNRGETLLRRALVEEGALQAVISLPRDSMQPVNNLDTHVLFAVKPGKNYLKNDGVWFYRPRYDGFIGGRNRQPSELNDLPLVREACRVNVSDGKNVQVFPLKIGENVEGYQITTEGSENFVVHKLGGGYLIEVSEKGDTTEFINVSGEYIFRGRSNLVPLANKLRPEKEMSGKFKAQSFTEYGQESSPEQFFSLENGVGELRSKSRSGSKSKGEIKITGILVDQYGVIASRPFPLTMDKSFAEEETHVFVLYEEDHKELSAFLIFFQNEINGFLLEGKGGRQIYLCNWTKENSVAQIFYPDRNILLFLPPSRDADPNAPTFQPEVFASDQVHRGILFTKYSIALGYYISRQEILKSKSVELQPEKYWMEKPQIVVTRSTAQILGDIKRNQNKLTSTLDRLLSISETQAVASAELPPRVQAITPSQDLMQGIQQSIWEIVLYQVEPAGDHDTPTAFQADDIYSKLRDNASIMDVQRALELFERMGLIVAVTYEGVPYYRLPTERDIVTEAGK